MREHALFTIRNLLKNNQENQDFVCVLEAGAALSMRSYHCTRADEALRIRSEALKPQYRVGQNGELMDLPPALRKS
jgi:ataxin-10